MNKVSNILSTILLVIVAMLLGIFIESRLQINQKRNSEELSVLKNDPNINEESLEKFDSKKDWAVYEWNGISWPYPRDWNVEEVFSSDNNKSTVLVGFKLIAPSDIGEENEILIGGMNSNCVHMHPDNYFFTKRACLRNGEIILEPFSESKSGIAIRTKSQNSEVQGLFDLMIKKLEEGN